MAKNGYTVFGCDKCQTEFFDQLTGRRYKSPYPGAYICATCKKPMDDYEKPYEKIFAVGLHLDRVESQDTQPFVLVDDAGHEYRMGAADFGRFIMQSGHKGFDCHLIQIKRGNALTWKLQG